MRTRALVALVIALLWAAPSIAAVTYDNSNKTSGASTDVTLSFTLAIGGGVTNGAVAIGISFYLITPSAITCTVGGVSASAISGTDSGSNTASNRTMWFGLATGSTTGNQTVTCSWTTASSAVMGAISASGVDQTTPFQNGTFNGNFSAGPLTVTVTSATDNFTATVGSASSNNTLSAATQTERWNANDTSFNLNGAGQTAVGAATVTHQWTNANTSNWSISGVDFKAAATTTQTTHFGSLLGIGR